MNHLVKQAKRLIARRGESLLSSAVGDLDKLAVKLEKAEQRISIHHRARDEARQAEAGRDDHGRHR